MDKVMKWRQLFSTCLAGGGGGAGTAMHRSTGRPVMHKEIYNQELNFMTSSVHCLSVIPPLKKKNPRNSRLLWFNLLYLAGLGLVQRSELLSRALHGSGVFWRPRGIQTLCQDHASRWDSMGQVNSTILYIHHRSKQRMVLKHPLVKKI